MDVWHARPQTETMHIEGGGVSPTGKSFRVVRTCVRAVWLPSEIGVKTKGGRFPFSLFPPIVFPFIHIALGGEGGGVPEINMLKMCAIPGKVQHPRPNRAHFEHVDFRKTIKTNVILPNIYIYIYIYIY